MQPPLGVRELFRMDQGGLEVFAMLDQIGAEAPHRPVFLRAVAMRHHNRGREAVPGGGESHGLPEVSPRRGREAPDPRIPRDLPVDIIQGAADFERSDRGVIFVLHPEFASGARVEERPRDLRSRGAQTRIDSGRNRLDFETALPTGA